jgi:phage-related protein
VTFTFAPDFPCTESSKPRVNRMAVLSAEQRSTFGINAQEDKWDLSFSALTATTRDGIFAYLEARRGAVPFTWITPFGETASFVCGDWSTVLETCNYNSIRASFELQYVAGGPNLATPAAPTAAFSYAPDFTADLSYESQAKVIKYGDGYAQRFTMGLSAQSESWRLQFRNRSNAERALIRGYLRGARGVSSFQWTDPRSGVVGRYVCAEWSIEYRRFNNNNIDATFRRVFEP